MTSMSILARFVRFAQSLAGWSANAAGEQLPHPFPNVHDLAQHPDRLPAFVSTSPLVMRYLDLLGPLAWHKFPERNLHWPANATVVPYAAMIAAYLLKLDRHLTSMGDLRQFLLDHPAFVLAFGFPLVPSNAFPWHFDADASLPTSRHFTRLLRNLPNSTLQFLLDSSVSLIRTELADLQPPFAETISLDTKHVVAFVKENNPKAYVSDRFVKTRQPKGDPDCRLGCKRKHNRRTSSTEPPPTPTREPLPASIVSVGEYYWGYASGIVATKVPDWGEFVLAELTQPFNCADATYFFPLMADVERRLGFRPRFGALDAAYDSFYVHEYFVEAGGFAAVPWADTQARRKQFDDQGRPLCAAGLGMPLKRTYMKNSHCLIPHRCASYACPLLFPEPTGETCPIQHKNWPKGGCTTVLPLSSGTRARHELDRHGDAYKTVYRQRTATERINSQAKALGIERPKLRNGQAITNRNTLIYILINLRALRRIRRQKAQRTPPGPLSTSDPLE